MGQIITFYSYKGGVGRTMALANVAVLLSQWGYKTLIVDWDLEAPGLKFFFNGYFEDGMDLEIVANKEGIINLLSEAYHSPFQPPKSTKWQDFLIRIMVPNSRMPLDFLTTGKRGEDYFDQLRSLDLELFYEKKKGGFFVEQLRSEWKDVYDYVLVDSRTGITDIGGVCTIQLPDILILLFTATEQSLRGIIDVTKKVHNERKKLPFDRLNLMSVSIPGRFDTTEEYETSQEWLKRFSKELSDLYANWLPKSVDRRDFLVNTKIPYIPYFSFGEKLPVLEQGTKDPAGLGYAYESLAALIANNLEYVEQLLESRSEFVRAASKTKVKTTRPPSQSLPFADREDEIKLILSSFAPSYYLLDAPAGYGKTELMKELEQRLQEQNWSCAYMSIEEQGTLSDLAVGLVEQLEVKQLLVQHAELPWGLHLGAALQQQWKDADKEGLAFLIDLKERHALSIVKELLEDFIPAVQDSLRALEFFSSKHNRFRVILAGRYLAARKETITTPLPLKLLRLSPFDYTVIRDSAGEYLVGRNENTIKQLAAHLVYLTGGHPGCIAHALQMYRTQGMPPGRFLQLFGTTIWQDIVRKAVDDIRDGIPKGTRDLHKVLDSLSVFRYLDYTILRYMIKEYGIAELNSEHDLADELTATYLFDWKGRFLRDDITRRLLAIRLRHETPEEFSERCRKAQQMCADRLREPNVQRPEMWAIEYLFQSLQQYASVIQDPAQRLSIREKFLDEDVPRILQILVYDRAIPPQNRSEEQTALLLAIQKDWEFRFTVNYYLRQDQYSDEPYNILQNQIVHFFAQEQET